MKTRRKFLRDACLAASAASMAPWRAAAAEKAAMKSRPDAVIYAGSYPGWPWIAAGADGTLYCAFREGTVHMYSPVGKAMLSKSSDGGKTWSQAEVIVDAPEVDDRNVAIVELPNRELLVSYNTYDKALASTAMTVRSTDGGKTWSQPQPVGEPNTRTKSAAIVLAGGGLLLPLYVAPGDRALASLSHDNGASWTIVAIPNVEGFVGDEWSPLEIEPGRIVGIFRNNHRQGGGIFWMSESRDGGRTWSKPKPTNVRSSRHPSPAHFFRQGRTPTMIYADRRMVSVSAVRTSDPEFLQWDVEHRLPCYVYNADESPIADGSYPVSVAVGDHRRLVVDYEIRPETKRIAGYFVDFPQDW